MAQGINVVIPRKRENKHPDKKKKQKKQIHDPQIETNRLTHKNQVTVLRPFSTFIIKRGFSAPPPVSCLSSQ